MKRNIAWGLVVSLLWMALPAWAGWSKREMRHDVRFLTDRMAYELRLSPQQYDDVYEVNYDFLAQVRRLSHDVLCGYGYALERYYDCLDIRNDDLRWILSRAQYRRFLRLEHFYRPFCAHHNHFHLRVYLVYDDCDRFYFGRPHHYHTYCGGHYRTHYHNQSYYRMHRHPHYRHEVYDGRYRIRQDRATFDRHSRRDFLTAVRPNRVERPGVRPLREDRSDRDDGWRREDRPARPNRVERPRRSERLQQAESSSGIRPEGRPARRSESRSEVQRSRRSESRGEARRIQRSDDRRNSRTDSSGARRQQQPQEPVNYRSL